MRGRRVSGLHFEEDRPKGSKSGASTARKGARKDNKSPRKSARVKNTGKAGQTPKSSKSSNSKKQVKDKT